MTATERAASWSEHPFARLAMQVAAVVVAAGVIGIFAAVHGYGSRIAHAELTSVEMARDVAGNTASIGDLTRRTGAGDVSIARVETQVAAIRSDIEDIKRLLTEMLRERRTELAVPR